MEQYRQAVLSADFDAWGNTLAADVIVSPANAPTITGREAAVAWLRTFPTVTGFTVNVEELAGRGDLAFVRGTYELKMLLPDSSVATYRGLFFDLHQRQPDGTWPYKRVMFHSTEPLPSGSTSTR